VSRLVVIADANTERAERLREACAVRGYATRIVPHGAAALEMAVREAPDVLVAAGGLDLIDAAKLVEILRANPRTRRVRFVFVGDTPAGSAEEWGAATLPGDADPDEVGERVAELAARGSELDAVVQEAREVVEGRLSQIPLVDLLQLFHLNRRSGTIELRRRNSEGRAVRGRVHLRDGDVAQAITGAVRGEKALFRMLAWNEGSFAFRADTGRVDTHITTPTRALLLEGMRQIDEGKRLRAQLPARDAHVALKVRSGALPSVVQPLTQEVLLLLELYTQVGEIVDHSSFPDYQVLRTLQTLVQRGIVEVRARAPMPPPDAGLFRTAQVRRLREWSSQARGEGGAVRDAKLLVASCDPRLTEAFVALLRGLPGLTPHPRMENGIAADALGPIARLRIDDEVGIEFVHVPADARYAPLWPLAGHGALGTFLLLGGAVADAADALKPLAETLGALPRARLLHLLVRRPGEPDLADELRRNVALVEESMLYLLPLEGRKEPLERLRGAFSRIVP
jgi:CheY-like chemotaxis protein